ncbi:MAG: stage II sporulation protein E [Clostridiaceae bacterium]|nr:stage II sporulation protein E [Clostridiaceae bacterium]
MMKTVSLQMDKTGHFIKLITRFLLQQNNFLILISAFLLGKSNIAGMLSLGGAFFAASYAGPGMRLVTAAAVLLGAVFQGSLEAVYINAACMLLFCVLSIPMKRSNERMNIRAAAILFVSMLLPQLMLAGLRGFLLYDVLVSFFSSFLSFALYFIYRISIPIMSGSLKKALYGNEEAISAGLTAALILSGIGPFQIIGFSLRNVLCVLLLLLLSYKCGAGAGASAGAVIGLIISISSEFSPSIAGTYALCGMLAGILGNLGRVGAALGFILGNMVLAVYFNGASETLLYLREILAASVMFFSLPKKLLERLTDPFARGQALEDRKGYSRRIRDITAERLGKFSRAFLELSKTFGEIAQTAVPSERQDINVLFDRVADRICSDCSLCMHCWERSFYDTYQVMFQVVEKLETKGRVEESDIPRYFIDKCPRINDFVNAVNNMYELFRVGVVWKSKIGESRAVISRQFEGMARVIDSLAEEIDTEVDFLSPLEDAIAAGLRSEGIKARDVIAYRGLWGKYEVSVLHGGCGGGRKCAAVIDRIVSDAVGRKMARTEEGCVKGADGSCCLKYMEAENLKLTTGIARIPKYGSKVSGDSFTFLESGNGKYTLALSDGMGSGYGASAQSKATVGMLENFLESGFDKEMAVSLINSVLVLRSDEDNTCTIDISMVDLFSGEVEFIKIGAAPTYIKRSSRVETVRAATLPAGILPGLDAELARKDVDSGDMIIMVTDGVVDSMTGDEPGEKALMKYIQQLDSLNPQQVAASILDEAVRRCDGKPFDDLTVMAAKVWKRPQQSSG